jgi:hypothetical protein
MPCDGHSTGRLTIGSLGAELGPRRHSPNESTVQTTELRAKAPVDAVGTTPTVPQAPPTRLRLGLQCCSRCRFSHDKTVSSVGEFADEPEQRIPSRQLTRTANGQMNGQSGEISATDSSPASSANE